MFDDDDDNIWERKRGMYYDRDGREITLIEWCELMEERDLEYLNVAHDHVDDARVSTVWLGLNHAFLPGSPPQIFETMVFGGPLDGDQRRYTTEDQALAGHAEILAEVREAAVTGTARDPNENITVALIEELERRGDDA